MVSDFVASHCKMNLKKCRLHTLCFALITILLIFLQPDHIHKKKQVLWLSNIRPLQFNGLNPYMFCNFIEVNRMLIQVQIIKNIYKMAYNNYLKLCFYILLIALKLLLNIKTINIARRKRNIIIRST